MVPPLANPPARQRQTAGRRAQSGCDRARSRAAVRTQLTIDRSRKWQGAAHDQTGTKKSCKARPATHTNFFSRFKPHKQQQKHKNCRSTGKMRNSLCKLSVWPAIVAELFLIFHPFTRLRDKCLLHTPRHSGFRACFTHHFRGRPRTGNQRRQPHPGGRSALRARRPRRRRRRRLRTKG